MPSVVEFLNAPREYVVRSRWSIDIPITDLSSFLFTSPTAELSHKPVFFAAEKPDTHNLSLHSFRRLVKKIARGLRDAGLVPGQRVLVFSGNNVFYPALFLGIISTGGIFTGANPAFTTRELAFQLKDSGASFCIANAASIGCAVEAADQVGLERKRLFVFDDGLLLGDINGGGNDRWTTGTGEGGEKHGVRHWSEIVSEREDFEWKVFTTMEEMHQTAAINYSSGQDILIHIWMEK
jgi:4-coumarate--CoA ligase